MAHRIGYCRVELTLASPIRCEHIYVCIQRTLLNVSLYLRLLHAYVYGKYLFTLNLQLISFERDLKPVAVVGDLSANSQWKLGQQM